MKKRILSLALCVMMLVTLIPTVAMADTSVIDTVEIYANVPHINRAFSRRSNGAARSVPMFSCPTLWQRIIAQALKTATYRMLWTATSTAS